MYGRIEIVNILTLLLVQQSRIQHRIVRKEHDIYFVK